MLIYLRLFRLIADNSNYKDEYTKSELVQALITLYLGYLAEVIKEKYDIDVQSRLDRIEIESKHADDVTKQILEVFENLPKEVHEDQAELYTKSIGNLIDKDFTKLVQKGVVDAEKVKLAFDTFVSEVNTYEKSGKLKNLDSTQDKLAALAE